MTILNDADLIKLGTKIVEPFDETAVQPSSIDLTLEGEFLIPNDGARIDLRYDEPRKSMTHVTSEEYVLKPGKCLLGSTQQVVRCPNDLSCRVEGKSSLGRLFLAIHVTAGVVDAGWEGQITLEIVNHGSWDIVLYKGMNIAQLSYFKLSGECLKPYGKSRGSHYNGQMGPTACAGRRHLKTK